MSRSLGTLHRADELREIPLRDVLEWSGLAVRPEGVSYRARDEKHNIVATGSRWFDNKVGIGGGGAIDLCRHLTGADFSAACRILAVEIALTRSGVSLHSHSPLRRPQAAHIPFLELASRYARHDESCWPIARKYLVETRAIEAGIVDRLHAVGSIYANDHRPHSSMVFLHRTICGRVEGASLRDTRDASKFRPCLGDKLASWSSSCGRGEGIFEVRRRSLSAESKNFLVHDNVDVLGKTLDQFPSLRQGGSALEGEVRPMPGIVKSSRSVQHTQKSFSTLTACSPSRHPPAGRRKGGVQEAA